MADRRKILIATRSSGKLRELRELFHELHVDAIDVAAAGIPYDPREEEIESYPTFVENALAKARYFHGASGGMPTIGDDSGLEVDALNSAPGVLSKRFSGRRDLKRQALDDANNAKLLAELGLADVAAIKKTGNAAPRTARYRCAAAFVDGDQEIVREGSIEGRIIDSPRGSSGFGYDPYFEADELGGTFAEASWETKSRVSHRGRAFRALFFALRDAGKMR
ncbi:MAG TPA: non-canonical purine NTP pyrophosphatase [Gemmatimonadaceae bacterium]